MREIGFLSWTVRALCIFYVHYMAVIVFIDRVRKGGSFLPDWHNEILRLKFVKREKEKNVGY